MEGESPSSLFQTCVIRYVKHSKIENSLSEHGLHVHLIGQPYCFLCSPCEWAFTIVAMGGAWWVNIVISVNVYTEKNFYISGIRTRIVEVQYSTHLPTVSML